LINAMAARVFMSRKEPSQAEDVPEGTGLHLREVKVEGEVGLLVNEHALPRACWVPAWWTVDGVDDAIDALNDPYFDGRAACLVDLWSPGYTQLTTILPESNRKQRRQATDQNIDPSAAACQIKFDGAERVVLHVDAPQPGIVVLSDTYAPGWRVQVDGEPRGILRVNGLFRGVPVRAGDKEIVFEYYPLPYQVGKVVSLGALVLLVLSGLVGFVRAGSPG